MHNLKKNLRLVKKTKEGTVPLPFSANLAENRSHNLGKALGKGLGLLKNWSQLYTVKFSYRRKDGETDYFCEM